MRDDQLNSFLVVAEEGSFSRAEQKLYITKQAMRKQIEALEKEIGVPLLVRSPQGVQLTEAGAVFYAGAKQLLEQMQRLRVQTREAAGRRHTLRISVPSHPQMMLEKPLALFSARWPEEQVEILPEGWVLERLRQGELDLAECARVLYEPDMKEAGLFYRPVVQLPHICLMLPSHPLAKRKSLTAADLEGYTVTVDSLHRRKELLEYLKGVSVNVQEAGPMTRGTLMEQIMNTSLSHGIYYITAYFAQELRGIAAVPLEMPPKEIGLICRDIPSPALQRFLECVEECRPELQRQVEHSFV